MSRSLEAFALAALLCAAAAPMTGAPVAAQQLAAREASELPAKLGLGRPALPEEIAAWDTDVRPDGRSRKHTFVMDAKSVVTSPSPQAPPLRKGRNVLTGIAWSGRGTVKRVDVSLDGGRNWRPARLDGPVLDKSMARFYVDFDWQGEELMIQSRAIDSTGYVQPTKESLRKVRGVNSIYHNNGIQTWQVQKNGEVENVEVS